jgi:hypothetical protein
MSETAGVRMDVVAIPPWPDQWTPPWPVVAPALSESIVLDGDAAPETVGFVAALLMQHNVDPMPRGPAARMLRNIVKTVDLRLAGGVRVRDGAGNVVEPGCCCGVEEWCEWLDVTDGETSPWMGHDPWGWVEHEADALRVCSGPEDDSAAGHGAATATIVIPRAELPRLLDGLRADLEAFAARLREWAMEIDPEVAEPLAERFEAAFVRCEGPRFKAS